MALTSAPYVRLEGKKAEAVLAKLDLALHSSVRAAGARYVEVARCPKVGRLSALFPPWRLTIAVPKESPFDVFLGKFLPKWAAAQVASRLDTMITVRTPAPSAVLALLASRFPGVHVRSLARRGFKDVTYSVEATIDGSDASFEVDFFDDGDETNKALVSELEDAVAKVRQTRKREADNAAADVLQGQIERGELAAAAATYRVLYAAYCEGLSDDELIAKILAKQAELARLYARPR